MQLCFVHENERNSPPTFVRDLIRSLPLEVTVVHGRVPKMGGRPLLSQSVAGRAWRKVVRKFLGREWRWELTGAYLKAIRRCAPDVVFADFGTAAVGVMDACAHANVPLVARFNGYDAYQHDVLRQHKAEYALLFETATAIIAVSRAMRDQLIRLGAFSEKVHYITYGIDPNAFQGAAPGSSCPEFLAVGQFQDRKAPHLTILAFSRVVTQFPAARLKMVGAGPLLGPCKDLARAIGIQNSIEFVGALPHQAIRETMRTARCFVQHSVVAESGDSEGTPVAILEAQTAGLPVVSTQHAGIPEVVIDGETGFVVPEYDIEGMADRMLALAHDPVLAERMGRCGREHAAAHFSMEKCVHDLQALFESCVRSTTFDHVK